MAWGWRPWPPRLVVTPLGEEAVPAWVGLLREGFGLSDARIAHFRRAVGDGEVRLGQRDGQIAGTLALLPMAQWFGGRPVPVVGIAAVTVAAAQQRRGVATALLRGALVEARSRGVAVAVLHAATLPLYQRLGFARAGVCLDYRLSVARTLAPLADAALRPRLRMSRPDPVDRAVLVALRRRQARWSNGLVERPPLLWANLLEPCDRAPPVVHLIHGTTEGTAGVLEGYVVLPVTPTEQAILTISDLCLLSGDAARQTLSALATFGDPVVEVTWPGGYDDPLAFLAPEVEVDIDDWDVWLARVLDVAGALTARGYPEGLCAQLDFSVDDALFPANQGCWRLTVAAGRGRVERLVCVPTDPAVPMLTLSVATLAPLLTGYIGAPTLAAIGALEGSDRAVAVAAALFAGPAPWLADRF